MCPVYDVEMLETNRGNKVQFSDSNKPERIPLAFVLCPHRAKGWTQSYWETHRYVKLTVPKCTKYSYSALKMQDKMGEKL